MQRPRSEIIKPHLAPDGHQEEGTIDHPFKYPTPEQHRAQLRGTPYGAADVNRDPRSAVNGPNNPTVHSKSVRRYGHNPTGGDVHGSTGQAPVTQVNRGSGNLPIHVRENKPVSATIQPAMKERVDYFGNRVK
jgi:hypothetical protein